MLRIAAVVRPHLFDRAMQHVRRGLRCVAHLRMHSALAQRDHRDFHPPADRSTTSCVIREARLRREGPPALSRTAALGELRRELAEPCRPPFAALERGRNLLVDIRIAL